MTTLLSIDAGVKGGFAFWKENELVAHFNTPTIKSKVNGKTTQKIDYKACAELIKEFSPLDMAIEEQFVKEGQGYSKNIFVPYGVIVGLGHALCREVIIVPAVKWKRAFSLFKKGKKGSIDLVSKVYGLDFKLKDDGVAEAILIGRYINLLRKVK